MEGIQVILVQKESIDDQQPGQEEQYSVQFFQTKEIQVSQENPANIPDVEKQFLSNQHQHSVLEKLNTKCTKGSQPECQVRVQFAELLKSIIPQVDNERATQLHKLFFRLRKNEITGENFLWLVKDIVGCQLLTEAVEKVQIQVSSTKTSVGPGTEAKLPSKRHCGQEKPIEELVTLLPPSSKRQKTSEMISDQSIEQFNNVTAVSECIQFRGMEEQEKLFSGSLVGCQVSKLSLRVVQGEEEGMLVLQKSPLRGKLAKITSKFGIKNISKDVEQCLSLFVEERMRGLISNLIRISKQRLDFEKRRHNTLVTSDIRHQVEVINWKVKEDWGKQQAEEFEGGNQVGGVMEKDANCSATLKANEVKRMVNEILHTYAMNVAAQAAVGGNDLTSKWKLMAKKAPLKHDKRIGAMSNAQLNEQMIYMSSQTLPRKSGDGQESKEKVIGAASIGKVAMNTKEEMPPSQFQATSLPHVDLAM
ncbi:Transcription initiation factor TFIID subunit 4b [Camellia lanceoleosa]|uniref:Transcription initiation factor TFIID subunit 4b n=1 Tax=Camellia lanceoleosa TaxID=1840588 RepID=A0ACC0IS09_9ERIC|nr:Transcription initiation factor TFIID subunit 4b [Camellia lanceoleosa]